MKLGELSLGGARRRLARRGLLLRIAPFTVRIRSRVPELAGDISRVYAEYPVAGDDEFADFDVHVEAAPGLRRWVRPQVRFLMGREEPFDTLPREQAFAFLEWGLNWCLHAHLNEHLIIHAAVVERGGRAVVMPGEPGAGKSTLCAALTLHGWRLLSDELALIVPATGDLVPVVRPVSLKNESIDVIAKLAPERAVFARRVADTTKGEVAHLRPPDDSVARGVEPARPGWLIFPRYAYRHRARLEPIGKADAMIRAADESFNYSVLGTDGFRTMVDFVEASECYQFTYGHLDEALAVFDALASPGSESPAA